jgi:hypothetical protein
LTEFLSQRHLAKEPVDSIHGYQSHSPRQIENACRFLSHSLHPAAAT